MPRFVPLLTLSDERLAELAGDGDERAFGVLFDRYRAPLSRYCRSILRDDAEAADAFQNTMLSALRSLRREDPSGLVKPWLYRIAHNESISLIRRRRPEVQSVAELPDELAAGLDEESREALGELMHDLRMLPEQQRTALVLRELVGLEYPEIARVLTISAVAARKAVYEARVSLGRLGEGRQSGCAEIKRCISDGDRRTLRSRRVRAHLGSCSECHTFERSIRERRRVFALVPPFPGVALSALMSSAGAGKLLGGGAASLSSGASGAGAGGGSTLGSLAVGVKGLVACGLLAAAGAGFIATAHRGAPAPALQRQAVHRMVPAVAPRSAPTVGHARGARAPALRRRSLATGGGAGGSARSAGSVSVSHPAGPIAPALAPARPAPASPVPASQGSPAHGLVGTLTTSTAAAVAVTGTVARATVAGVARTVTHVIPVAQSLAQNTVDDVTQTLQSVTGGLAVTRRGLLTSGS